MEMKERNERMLMLQSVLIHDNLTIVCSHHSLQEMFTRIETNALACVNKNKIMLLL